MYDLEPSAQLPALMHGEAIHIMLQWRGTCRTLNNSVSVAEDCWLVRGLI